MKSSVLIGGKVHLDIALLLKTRLLIQANSGGGKSWLLRRLAEQLFGQVPVLIIDPEGEFATLREKFGFVLVGKGGETPADPRSAKLVAHKLLELRASAVCDIYEMNPSARHHWVKLFLEGLVDAPKNLWRPTIVIVDEAHTFCPEKGQGESEASEAMTALSTRGRKRRFCAVWATQRLAKLSKSATAEMLNRLIGPTFEDVDLRRAADLLSIPNDERREFEKEMRVLEPGTFYALGRAISTERVLVKVGEVQTSHEIEDSKQGLGPPPTPEKIKWLLPKLADLPKEAEDKQRTGLELRAEIRALKQQLAAAPTAEEKTIEVPVFDAQCREVLEKACKACNAVLVENEMRLKQFQLIYEELKKIGGGLVANHARLVTHRSPSPRPILPTAPRETNRNFFPPATIRNGELSGGLRRMMIALAQRPGLTKKQLGVRAGLSSTSGTFGAYLGRLRSNGWIDDNKELLGLSEAGIEALGNYEPLPEGEELLGYWLRDLGGSGAGRMLSVLAEVYPQALTKEALGERAGISHSSGTFGTYLGKLRTLELVEGRGDLSASREFFE